MQGSKDRPVLNNYAYLGDYRAVTMTNYGRRLMIDTRNIQNYSIITHGEFEPAVAWAIRQHTKRGDTVIDVGANLGFFTLLACQQCGPNGHVYALEPNPDIFGLLSASVKINAFAKRATLHNAAAFREDCELNLTWDEATHGGARLQVSDRGRTASRVAAVDARTLDGLIEPRHLPVGLMKIDTEGSEPYVFEGASKVLDASPNCVVVTEWNPGFMRGRGGDPEQLIASLRKRFRKVKHLIGPGKTQDLDFSQLAGFPHANLLLMP